MPKLHLKRTPAEEAERQYRKSQKAVRKKAKARRQSEAGFEDDEDGITHASSSSKRRRTNTYVDDLPTQNGKSYPDIDEDDHSYGPPPPSGYPDERRQGYKPDYDAIRAQLEDERFREKMWDAFQDDERLDATEARFNDHAHMPRRWRRNEGDFGGVTDDADIDPRTLDDDEYAEWIRRGMWRKKHAKEYEEQARIEAEKAARRKREEANREQTSRLEKAAEQERLQKRRLHDGHRREEARTQYERRWKELLDGKTNVEGKDVLAFEDIPWPIFTVGKKALDTKSPLDAETFNPTDILAFLIPSSDFTLAGMTKAVGIDLVAPGDQDNSRKRSKKEKLRETMLRFHPDKFEGRIIRMVREQDKQKVREAVGQITRALNKLMAE